MLKPLKRIIPFLLLAVVILAGARYIIFTTLIQAQKAEFRKVVIKKQADVKKLVLSAKELYQNSQGLEWLEDHHEVILNGVYYDVVSVQKSGRNYTVSIAEDSWETDLFRVFFDMEDVREELPYDSLTYLEMDFFMPSVHTWQRYDEVIEHSTQYLQQERVGHAFRLTKPPCV